MKKIKIKNKNKKGYLIWLTGFSGSGKSTIAKKIIANLEKEIGPTLLINGDDIRKIFELNSFDYKSRKKVAYKYSELSSFITRQGINVIFATVSMFHDVRKQNRKKSKKKYIEIYIKSQIKKIIDNKKKKIYFSAKKIVGKHIKAELPKNPDILVLNDFSKSLSELSSIITKKILDKLKK